MNLRDFASALMRSWLVIAAATVVGLTGGWVVGNSARTVYSTTSRVVVLVAPSVGTPEDAQHVTSMIRSEMSLYQVLAQKVDVTDRVASQVPGMTASEVSGSTAVTVTDQVIAITVSLPNAEQSAAVAKALANELAGEIKNLHSGDQQLIRVEAVTARKNGPGWGWPCDISGFRRRTGSCHRYRHRMGAGFAAALGRVRRCPDRRRTAGVPCRGGRDGV